jgi:hypothetical protein
MVLGTVSISTQKYCIKKQTGRLFQQSSSGLFFSVVFAYLAVVEAAAAGAGTALAGRGFTDLCI